MTVSMMIELFGYLGSAMVVISMLMSSVIKLRVINTVGSVISGTYALIIGSFPLALMNICLVLINLYNLRKLLITKQPYHLVKCSREEATVQFFLEQYREDIRQYFVEPKPEGDVAYLIFCGTAPAGILLGQTREGEALQVVMEYTTPEYRDCSIGKFLYAMLPEEGIRALAADNWTQAHRTYLEKMGYTEEKGKYIKILP